MHQIWYKLAPCFWRKIWKCEKLTHRCMFLEPYSILYSSDFSDNEHIQCMTLSLFSSLSISLPYPLQTMNTNDLIPFLLPLSAYLFRYKQWTQTIWSLFCFLYQPTLSATNNEHIRFDSFSASSISLPFPLQTMNTNDLIPFLLPLSAYLIRYKQWTHTIWFLFCFLYQPTIPTTNNEHKRSDPFSASSISLPYPLQTMNTYDLIPFLLPLSAYHSHYKQWTQTIWSPFCSLRQPTFPVINGISARFRW